MKTMMKTILSLFLGIVLIVAGTAVLTYQGITFSTPEQQLVSLGPLRAGTQDFNWTITLPPILGAVLLAGGTLLVFVIAIARRAPKREKDLKPAVGSRLTESMTK